MLELDELQHFDTLSGEAARQYAIELIFRLRTQLQSSEVKLKFEQTKNQALNFELMRLKQWRFGSSSESMDSAQTQLFDAKLEAVLLEESKAEDRGAEEAKKPAQAKRQAKRQALPAGLERIEHHYEIEPAVCPQGHALKRIGEEISEQLDCVPAQFFVHRHIRGKYTCACCQTVLAAAMPAQVIDKGKDQVSDGPHIVQLATLDKAWVFQLHDPACRAVVAQLLALPGFTKAGFGLGDDRKRIQSKLGVQALDVLELNTVFRQRGYRKDMGVKGAVAVLFKQRFIKSKKAATSNWSLPSLSQAQLVYAANDAYAAIRVFHALGLA